jgi:putative membrane protein
MVAASTHRQALLAGFVLVALGVAGGCRTERAGAAGSGDMGTRDGVSDTATMRAPADTRGTTGERTGMRDGGEWSDAKILRIAMTANTIDSTAGAHAARTAQSPAVKEFAQTMMRDHGAANKKARDLMRSANIPDSAHVDEDDPAAEMAKDAQDAMGKFREKAGTEFDEAYIDHEVDMHQKVLDQIDNDLLPNAQSQAIRAYLQEIRPVVAAHLERAKQLKDQVGRTSS